MKKITPILAALILLLLSGCSKTDEVETFSLVGKTYAATKYFGSYGTIIDPYTAYYVIRITSENTIECSDRENSVHGPLLGYSEIITGTYTLNYPNIHLEYNDPMFPSTHLSIDAVFIDETCFRDRSTNREYVLQ